MLPRALQKASQQRAETNALQTLIRPQSKLYTDGINKEGAAIIDVLLYHTVFTFIPRKTMRSQQRQILCTLI